MRGPPTRVFICVPQIVIAAGFEYEEIVMPDGTVKIWDPASCVGRQEIEGLEEKVASKELKEFLGVDPDTDTLIDSAVYPMGRIFICTHATLVRVFNDLKDVSKDCWRNVSLIIDETHHSKHEGLDEEDNELGKVVKHYLDLDSGPLTLMTATWMRSDGRIVGGQRQRFTTDTYHMDEYLKDELPGLRISFRFILGEPVDCLTRLVAADPHRKTVAWLPSISGWMLTREAKLDMLAKCMSGLKKLNVSVLDLVDDDDTRKGLVRDLRDKIKFGRATPDLLLALNLLQEGFDMPELSRAILLAPRGQIRVVLQMLGRLLRPFKDKTDIEFNIIIPAELAPEDMGSLLKVIFAYMCVEWQFRQADQARRSKRRVERVVAEQIFDPEVYPNITKAAFNATLSHDGEISDEELVDEILSAVPELATFKKRDEKAAVRKTLTQLFQRFGREASDVPLDFELKKTTISGLVATWLAKFMVGGRQCTIRDLRLALGKRVFLTEKSILEDAAKFHIIHGEYPKDADPRPVPDKSDETWIAYSIALRKGLRGLPGGTSLPRLLDTHGLVRNHLSAMVLTPELIVGWMRVFQRTHGVLPSENTIEPVPGQPLESWPAIASALRSCNRGLPPGLSLAKLKEKHFSWRNAKNTPPLTVDQVVAWMRVFMSKHGRLPKQGEKLGVSGQPGESWRNIQAALCQGGRGLPGGSSLVKLGELYFGAPNRGNRPKITEQEVVSWIRAFKDKYGVYPTETERREVPGQPEETWQGLKSALKKGCRGLPGDSSLIKLAEKHFAYPLYSQRSVS
jgi:hypothetical protein